MNIKRAKARVLSLASTMFFQYGIRKVKMNDIAAHLKISKRTLYEIYQNKERPALWGCDDEC